MLWTCWWLGSKTHGFQSLLYWQFSPCVQLQRGCKQNGALLRKALAETAALQEPPKHLPLSSSFTWQPCALQGTGKNATRGPICWKEKSKEAWKAGWGGQTLPSSPVLPAIVSLALMSHGTEFPVHTPTLPGNLEGIAPAAEDPWEPI